MMDDRTAEELAETILRALNGPRSRGMDPRRVLDELRAFCETVVGNARRGRQARWYSRDDFADATHYAYSQRQAQHYEAAREQRAREGNWYQPDPEDAQEAERQRQAAWYSWEADAFRHAERQRARQREVDAEKERYARARDEMMGRAGLRGMPKQRRPWREVLGVAPGWVATKAGINSAHRLLAVQLHPDKGGTHEQMVELNNARDEALREVR